MHIQHHSEEAQEILSRIPGWITRWGVTLICIIILGLIIGSYFIRYPDKIKTQIEITTTNPPVDLIAQSTGRISKLFVADKSHVQPNEVIALLYNTANYDDVNTIYDSLMHHAEISKVYNLGELQSDYNEYLRILMEYKYYIDRDYLTQRQTMLRGQIDKNRKYYSQLVAQRANYEKDISYERQNFNRDSILYMQGVISVAEYETSLRSMLQKYTAKGNFEVSLTATEVALLQMEQQLSELAMQRESELSGYIRILSASRQNLITQIEQWQDQYLIKSPIDGRVTFSKHWYVNQTINAGERLVSVVPDSSSNVIGRMVIPFTGIAKVAIGQTVNVKLGSYPYMEFGILKGEIISIAEVPESNGYVAEVTFPDGLLTTYKKPIQLMQQMNGVAEILTKDLCLLQRFLQPIRTLFD